MSLSFKIHLGTLLSSIMSSNSTKTKQEDVTYYLSLISKEYGKSSVEYLWLRAWNSIYLRSPQEAELLLRKYIKQLNEGVVYN